MNAVAVYNRLARARAEREVGPDGVFDLTSKGPDPWVRFSPFYPHGGIPVPGWPGLSGESVEGIWQGLKRFEHEDATDPGRLANRSMRGLKRTSRAKGANGVPRGRVLGHQYGPDPAVVLDYATARRRIYLPAYRWVLDHRLSEPLAALRTAAGRGPVALLDYETNADVADLSRPLSHAALVAAYLSGAWPDDPAASR